MMMLTVVILVAMTPGFLSRRPKGMMPFLFEDFNMVSDSVLPRFAEPIPNVTVTVGRDALMACVVENLRNYKPDQKKKYWDRNIIQWNSFIRTAGCGKSVVIKQTARVAWVRVDTQTILSIHHSVITQNPRVSLSFNDHRSWFLHISNVQDIDRGWYMCQVNTDPMRSRQGYLQVVVPPRILERESSNDIVVRETNDVTLQCRAHGYPEPYVMWRREDGRDINYNGEMVNVIDGEVLNIKKVSRLHMGAYLCIASNGVPPSISRRVFLRVQFPPMLSIPNQLEGAYLGKTVELECQTEAFPSSINYWTTEKGEMIVNGDKYTTSSIDQGYSKFMTLEIKNVTRKDFGTYQCVAKNSLGETDGVIKLEEIILPTSKTTSSNAIPTSGKEGSKMKQERFSKDEEENYLWEDGDFNEENEITPTVTEQSSFSSEGKASKTLTTNEIYVVLVLSLLMLTIS